MKPFYRVDNFFRKKHYQKFGNAGFSFTHTFSSTISLSPSIVSEKRKVNQFPNNCCRLLFFVFPLRADEVGSLSTEPDITRITGEMYGGTGAIYTRHPTSDNGACPIVKNKIKKLNMSCNKIGLESST